MDIARATDDDDDDGSNDARTRARDRVADETRAARVVVVDACAVGVARMRTARDAFESDVSERSGRLRVRRVTRARARLSRLATDGMDVAIVKLGGAALTVKSRRGTIDARGFADCVETVARARARGDGTRVIVAHGAGSFGHGARCEWMTTTRWTDGETVRRTQRRRGRAGARAAATSTGTRRSREGWTRRGVKCEN